MAERLEYEYHQGPGYVTGQDYTPYYPRSLSKTQHAEIHARTQSYEVLIKHEIIISNVQLTFCVTSKIEEE